MYKIIKQLLVTFFTHFRNEPLITFNDLLAYIAPFVRYKTVCACARTWHWPYKRLVTANYNGCLVICSCCEFYNFYKICIDKVQQNFETRLNHAGIIKTRFWVRFGSDRKYVRSYIFFINYEPGSSCLVFNNFNIFKNFY